MSYEPHSARAASGAPQGLVWQSFTPHPALAPFVSSYWELTVERSQRIHLLPDGCVDLTFELGDRPTVHLARPHESADSHQLEAGFALFGARFHPGGAAALLGIEIGELPRHDWFDATQALGRGARELAEQLLEFPAERAALCEAWLLSRLKSARLDVRLQGAVGSILGSGGLAPVSDVSSSVPLRTLDRLFTRFVGLSPKRLSRIVRFQRAITSLRDGPPREGWAAFALDHGYADQAHLVREFSAFGGESPRPLLRSLEPPRYSTR